MDPGWVAVVDDDPAVLSALARLLRSAGLRVQTFASADEYLTRTPGGAPSCIVLDVNLPRSMSGFELQAHVARGEAPVPVILMTGHDEISTEALAARAGPGGFLRKPFDQEALFEAIARSTITPPLDPPRDSGRV
jgi:FixJ family two-component response regulator